MRVSPTFSKNEAKIIVVGPQLLEGKEQRGNLTFVYPQLKNHYLQVNNTKMDISKKELSVTV